MNHVSSRWLVACLGLALACPILSGADGQDEDASNPPSKAQTDRFARQLEKAVRDGDARAFNQMVDWDAVLDRALKGIDASETTQGFRDGFLQSINGQEGFTASIVNAVRQGGSMAHLRNLEKEDRVVSLFRLVLPDGGFNYIEFELTRGDDGNAEAVDVFPYTSGETTSTTLRRAVLPLVKEQERNLLDRLIGTDSLYVKHADEISRFAELVAGGDARQAKVVYERLPDELKQDKNVLLLRLRATQQLGDKEYGAALDDLRKFYPNDPSGDLLSIDAYLINNNYDDALSCIDRLDERVLVDPYLDVVRAGVMVLKKDFDRAAEFAKQAAANERVSLDGYWSLVSISLNRPDYVETIRLLKEMDRKFELQWSDFTQLPEFEGFVQSAQHALWLQYLDQ